MSHTNYYQVTGGAGFIGSHLVDCLINLGYRVRVTDNFSSGLRVNLQDRPNLEVIKGDIRNYDDLNRALAGTVGVFHQAALVSVQASVEARVNSFENNALSTLNVFEASRKNGIQKSR